MIESDRGPGTRRRLGQFDVGKEAGEFVRLVAQPARADDLGRDQGVAERGDPHYRFAQFHLGRFVPEPPDVPRPKAGVCCRAT